MPTQTKNKWVLTGEEKSNPVPSFYLLSPPLWYNLKEGDGMMATFDNTIIGKKFGMLTVTDECIKNRNGTIWKCICDCGNEAFVYRGKLTTGHTKSCGCITKTLGGLSKHPLYKTWWSMKERCYSKNHSYFKHYGGRGIAICPEWKSDFMSFYSWSLDNGYQKGLSIDRIDNDGDYEPENCQWLTISENTAKANKGSFKRKTEFTYWGISPEGEKVEFSNASEFSRINGLHAGGVTRVARGDRSHYKNWKFGYTNKNNK